MISESEKKMIKRICILFCFMLLFSAPIYAAENSKWVVDEPNVLSQETVDYVTNLNENVFPGYKNKPQLAIVVLDQLPKGYSIDKHKKELFNQYGVGTATENCGLLFEIALTDRKYGLEIGNGYNNRPLLKNDLSNDFITADMKSLLVEKNYDAMIKQTVMNLETILANEEAGIYIQKEAEFLAQKQIAEQTTANNINQQQILLQKAKTNFMFGLKTLILIVCTAIMAGIIGSIIRKQLFIKSIKKQLSQLTTHLKLSDQANNQKEVVKLCWQQKHKYSSTDALIMAVLYDKYIHTIKQQLTAKTLTNNVNDYVDYLKAKNNIDKFTRLNLLRTYDIIEAVDKEIATKQATKKANIEKYTQYIHSLTLNENLVSKQSLIKQIDSKEYYSDNELLSEHEIATNVDRLIDQMTFDAEYQDFLSKNSDKIDHRNFSKNRFYKEVQQSNDYRTYGNSIFNNPALLLMLLMMHSDNIMAENKAIESNNSSSYSRNNNISTYDNFGGGFDGGSSSGGGFSGGW